MKPGQTLPAARGPEIRQNRASPSPHRVVADAVARAAPRNRECVVQGCAVSTLSRSRPHADEILVGVIKAGGPPARARPSESPQRQERGRGQPTVPQRLPKRSPDRRGPATRIAVRCSRWPSEGAASSGVSRSLRPAVELILAFARRSSVGCGRSATCRGDSAVRWCPTPIQRSGGGARGLERRSAAGRGASQSKSTHIRSA
jgi:hypothetical protein